MFFLSRSFLGSEWAFTEVETVFGKYPKQVLPALLEPIEVPFSLARIQSIPLYREGCHDLDMNRLNDLIVRLYWLIQQGDH